MANPEHVDRLKQGVEQWNQWRGEHPGNQIDLGSVDFSDADLSHANLSDADLNRANLSRVNLSYADLSEAFLIKTDLSEAKLNHANLSGAFLSEADLSRAEFDRANLSRVELDGANLSFASLESANLSFANLESATFNFTHLDKANFTQAQLRWTIFNNVDLRNVKGLNTLEHMGPSSIGIGTIYDSQGEISESFLRQVGIPESFIINMRALVESMSPIDFYSCFISYSSKDQRFAERLYTDLQGKGVRCWFAPEDLKIGDHYHQRIDESIRLYDKLILILSAHAVQSAWVEREVVSAREKEDRQQRPVLFPLRLDDAVMDTTKAWAADVRRRWHIGDFTQWKHHDAYQQAFERLLRDLKAEEKP